MPLSMLRIVCWTFSFSQFCSCVCPVSLRYDHRVKLLKAVVGTMYTHHILNGWRQLLVWCAVESNNASCAQRSLIVRALFGHRSLTGICAHWKFRGNDPYVACVSFDLVWFNLRADSFVCNVMQHTGKPGCWCHRNCYISLCMLAPI